MSEYNNFDMQNNEGLNAANEPEVKEAPKINEFAPVQSTEPSPNNVNAEAPKTEANSQPANPNYQGYYQQNTTPTYYSYTPNTNNYYTNNQPYYHGQGQNFGNQRPPKKHRGLKITLAIIGIVAIVVSTCLIGYWAVSGVVNIYRENKNNSSLTSSQNNDTKSNNQDDNQNGNNSDYENLIINGKPSGANEYVANSDGTMTSAAVIAKVRPSIVGIIQYVNSNNVPTVNGYGSGIIISDNGYIITNAHVVDGATMLTVVLENNKEYKATLKGLDTQSDLAVIKIEANGLVAAELGDSSQTVLGENVIAIGNPGGLELSGSCTGGMVSGLNRTISGDATGYAMSYIQTDAAINPGNSGGALVNMYGQVIGINSAKITADGYEGLGFAIPINEALPIINDLQKYGYVKNRAKIGIGFQFISDAVSQYYNNEIPAGLLITQIDDSCDIATKDVRVKDIITKIDGKKISSTTAVYSILKEKKPGDTLKLTVFRAGTRFTNSETFEVTIILSEDKGQ